MSVSADNNNGASAEGFGKFAKGVTLWSRTIATASPDKRPTVFRNCVEEGAGFVRMGADRDLIVDALIERAEQHDLLEALGGIDVVETIIGKAFARQSVANGNRGRSPPPGQNEPTASDSDSGVGLDDFVAYMPTHAYIFTPARELWPASSVNARVPPVPLFDGAGHPVLNKKGEQELISASAWLDQNRPVEQMTWSPGDPMLIDGRLISEGGWIPRPDCHVFNLYRPPPNIIPGNKHEAKRWRDHVVKVYGDDSEHIIQWLSHRVQKPQEKINHALLMGGAQGIGKDTLLEPVKRAIGPWNFSEVSPSQIMGRFNGFLKSVILRVSEARDLGDTDRFKFYDHMKAYTAAPPDVLRVDEKNLREHAVLNVTGVIITSNHLTDGIYLPADDRRHFVAWSNLTKEDFTHAYWTSLWAWLDAGGDRHVATYLAELDLAGFNPKAPPPKTAAFWSVVDASRSPEDAELADVLDNLGNPNVTTLERITSGADETFAEWLKERKNRRVVGHRLEECGYARIRNDDSKDGLWVIGKKRQVVYARKDLSVADSIQAARGLK